MDVAIQTALSEYVIEDQTKRNAEYAREAIELWDKEGKGSFQKFFLEHMFRRWWELGMKN